MNFNAILAILELKGIITREEGEKVVEHINNKPQSTLLADAVEQMKELVDEVKPVVAAAIEGAEKAAKEVAQKAVDEVKDIDKAVKDAATKEKAKKATDSTEK